MARLQRVQERPIQQGLNLTSGPNPATEIAKATRGTVGSVQGLVKATQRLRAIDARNSEIERTNEFREFVRLNETNTRTQKGSAAKGAMERSDQAYTKKLSEIRVGLDPDFADAIMAGLEADKNSSLNRVSVYERGQMDEANSFAMKAFVADSQDNVFNNPITYFTSEKQRIEAEFEKSRSFYGPEEFDLRLDAALKDTAGKGVEGQIKSQVARGIKDKDGIKEDIRTTWSKEITSEQMDAAMDLVDKEHAYNKRVTDDANERVQNEVLSDIIIEPTLDKIRAGLQNPAFANDPKALSALRSIENGLLKEVNQQKRDTEYRGAQDFLNLPTTDPFTVTDVDLANMVTNNRDLNALREYRDGILRNKLLDRDGYKRVKASLKEDFDNGLFGDGREADIAYNEHLRTFDSWAVKNQGADPFDYYKRLTEPIAKEKFAGVLESIFIIPSAIGRLFGGEPEATTESLEQRRQEIKGEIPKPKTFVYNPATGKLEAE